MSCFYHLISVTQAKPLHGKLHLGLPPDAISSNEISYYKLKGVSRRTKPSPPPPRVNAPIYYRSPLPPQPRRYSSPPPPPPPC